MKKVFIIAGLGWLLLGLLVIGYGLFLEPESSSDFDAENFPGTIAAIETGYLEDRDNEVLKLFTDIHRQAVADVGDESFRFYVDGVLEELCPYYFPNGLEFRNCLQRLIDERQPNFSAEQVSEFESYCEAISEEYKDGIESLNLYLSCMAYKLK